MLFWRMRIFKKNRKANKNAVDWLFSHEYMHLYNYWFIMSNHDKMLEEIERKITDVSKFKSEEEKK